MQPWYVSDAWKTLKPKDKINNIFDYSHYTEQIKYW